jgi:chromosome condensin MukBEF complex kleisin-like MukF subunit
LEKRMRETAERAVIHSPKKKSTAEVTNWTELWQKLSMDNHKSQKKNKINQEKQVDWIEAMKDMNYKGIEVVTQ